MDEDFLDYLKKFLEDNLNNKTGDLLNEILISEDVNGVSYQIKLQKAELFPTNFPDVNTKRGELFIKNYFSVVEQQVLPNGETQIDNEYSLGFNDLESTNPGLDTLNKKMEEGGLDQLINDYVVELEGDVTPNTPASLEKDIVPNDISSIDTPTNVVDDVVDYDLVNNEFGELLPVIKNPNNFPLPANSIFGRPLSQDEFMRILIERDRDVYLEVFEDAASITGIKLPDYKPSTIKKVFGFNEYNFNKYASSYYDDYLIKTYWQNKQKDIVDIVQKIKTGQINNINSKKLTQFIYELQAFETSGRFQNVDEKADIVKKIIFGNEPILETGVDFGSDFGKYVEAVGVDKEVVTILQNNSENIKTILKDTINKELKNIYPNEYIVVFRSPNINTLDNVDNLLNSYSKDLSVSQEMSRYQTPDGNVPYFATEEGKAGVKAYLVPTNEIIDTEALGIRGGIKQNEKEILINPDKVTELDVSVIEDMKSNKEIKINKLLSETPTNVIDDIKMKPIFTGTEALPTGDSFVYADIEEIFDFVQFNRRDNPMQPSTNFSSEQIDAIKKTILEKGYIYDTGEMYNSAVVFPVSVDISGEIQIGEGNHRLLAAYEVAKETNQKIFVPIHIYTGGVVKGGQNQTRLVDRKNLYNALKELFKDVGASEYAINEKIGKTFDSVKQYSGSNYLGSGGSGGNSTSQENIKKFFSSIGVDTFTYQELPENNVFKTGVNTLTDTPGGSLGAAKLNDPLVFDSWVDDYGKTTTGFINDLPLDTGLRNLFINAAESRVKQLVTQVTTPGGILDTIDIWEIGVLALIAGAIAYNEIDEIPKITKNAILRTYNLSQGRPIDAPLRITGVPILEVSEYDIDFEYAMETLEKGEKVMPTEIAIDYVQEKAEEFEGESTASGYAYMTPSAKNTDTMETTQKIQPGVQEEKMFEQLRPKKTKSAGGSGARIQ